MLFDDFEIKDYLNNFFSKTLTKIDYPEPDFELDHKLAWNYDSDDEFPTPLDPINNPYEYYGVTVGEIVAHHRYKPIVWHVYLFGNKIKSFQWVKAKDGSDYLFNVGTFSFISYIYDFKNGTRTYYNPLSLFQEQLKQLNVPYEIKVEDINEFTNYESPQEFKWGEISKRSLETLIAENFNKDKINVNVLGLTNRIVYEYNNYIPDKELLERVKKGDSPFELGTIFYNEFI